MNLLFEVKIQTVTKHHRIKFQVMKNKQQAGRSEEWDVFSTHSIELLEQV